MYLLYVFIIAAFAFFCSPSHAGQEAGTAPVEDAALLAKKCNLEARNSLVNGDIATVENICSRAIQQIESTDADKDLLINSLLNLALAYSLAGEISKAEPLYSRAGILGKSLYQPGSRELKEINDFIERQEVFRKQHRKP